MPMCPLESCNRIVKFEKVNRLAITILSYRYRILHYRVVRDVEHTQYEIETVYHKMKTMRSQRHQLGSYQINKISLSCFDDKRYLHK